MKWLTSVIPSSMMVGQVVVGGGSQPVKTVIPFVITVYIYPIFPSFSQLFQTFRDFSQFSPIFSISHNSSFLILSRFFLFVRFWQTAVRPPWLRWLWCKNEISLTSRVTGLSWPVLFISTFIAIHIIDYFFCNCFFNCCW